MKALFYIVPESFKYNGASQIDIEKKIGNFAIDLQKIKDHTENEIFCHPAVYNVEIFKNTTISDVLYQPATKLIDRDVIQQLRIIWEINETNDSTNDICDIHLPNHNEDICYGLIAFNPINNILPEYQLIYGIESWFKFRRHFLGIYPKNSEYFIDECKLYYDSLFFHEDNKIFIRRLFPQCIKKVIYHLTELNDKFPNSKTIPYNRRNTLRNFNGIYNHDGQEASIQGDIRKKDDLTFVFKNNKGENKNKYCELHLKISLDDNSIFSNDRRIYFCEGEENIEDGKILIGHIGKHL